MRASFIFYINVTTIFTIRPCIMFRRHFTVSLFHALICKFLSKYGNTNSTFHSGKISVDSKHLNRFVNKMVLSLSMKI